MIISNITFRFIHSVVILQVQRHQHYIQASAKTLISHTCKHKDITITYLQAQGYQYYLLARTNTTIRTRKYKNINFTYLQTKRDQQHYLLANIKKNQLDISANKKDINTAYLESWGLSSVVKVSFINLADGDDPWWHCHELHWLLLMIKWST